MPDLVHSVTGDRFLVPRAAWDDQLVDVSDVIDSQKAEFHPTALSGSRFYNAKLKKHSFYTVPIKCSTLMEQVWRPLIEEAGFSDADIPKTHDAYFDFFQTVQDKLRVEGQADLRTGILDGGEGGRCRHPVPSLPDGLRRHGYRAAERQAECRRSRGEERRP